VELKIKKELKLNKTVPLPVNCCGALNMDHMRALIVLVVNTQTDLKPDTTSGVIGLLQRQIITRRL
jgi:hypothetical protein